MFLKVHDAVQLHVVRLAADNPVFVDELLRTDTVADAPQVEITVKQQQLEQHGDRHGDSRQGQILHTPVPPHRTA